MVSYQILLQEDGLTLDKAIVIAQQMGVANREAATLSSTSSEVRAVTYKDPKKRPVPALRSKGLLCTRL